VRQRDDQGKVVVEVGIAPVKPAEFVIFRIAQIKETSA
jgi:phage tail sheath protein FI